MPIDGSSYQQKLEQNRSLMKNFTNNEPQINRIRQENSRMSIESLNSNGNNANNRRKLPTLPPAKQLPQIPQSRVQSM